MTIQTRRLAIVIVVVICGSSVMSCRPNLKTPAGVTPSDDAQLCQNLSATDADRIRASKVFANVAHALGRNRMSDSTGAAEYARWLCGELRVHALSGIPDIRLASLVELDTPHRVDIVFAVSRDSVILLSPQGDSMPVGGLDIGQWNRFVGPLGLTLVDLTVARTLACALHRVQELSFTSPECEQGDLIAERSLDDGWEFHFNSRPGVAPLLRLSGDGTVH